MAAVSYYYACGQTDKQTRSSQYCTPLPRRNKYEYAMKLSVYVDCNLQLSLISDSDRGHFARIASPSGEWNWNSNCSGTEWTQQKPFEPGSADRGIVAVLCAAGKVTTVWRTSLVMRHELCSRLNEPRKDDEHSIYTYDLCKEYCV